MNSHASSWLSATWPRRRTPARPSAGSKPAEPGPLGRQGPAGALRAQRRVDRDSLPLPAGACTDTSHTPPAPGASSWTTSRGRSAR